MNYSIVGNLEELTYGPVDIKFVEDTIQDFKNRLFETARAKGNSVTLSYVHSDKRVYLKIKTWILNSGITHTEKRSRHLNDANEYVSFMASW